MKLTLGWLYYDLMNTYGDRGNALILKDRAERRGINFSILPISIHSSYRDFLKADLFLMGGAEDRQQKIVSDDMVRNKEKALKEAISDGVPGLYVCGAYQFLGEYYEAADHSRVRCLSILPFHTRHPGSLTPRLIGNLVVKLTNPELTSLTDNKQDLYMIGFENHGGRTYVHSPEHTLGETIKGFGNNDDDHSEGFIYKNTIGTYAHGPLLPRNPLIADFLLTSALKRKYKDFKKLAPLKDELVEKNRAYLLKQFL